MGGSSRPGARRRRLNRAAHRAGAIATTLTLAATLVVITAGPASAATFVVNQNHEHGWHMQHTVGCGATNDAENTGDMTFEPGPQGAPGQPGDQGPGIPIDSDSPNGGPPGPSSGSLEFRTGSNGNTVELFRNDEYDGMRLDAIKELRYWTYVDPEQSTNPLEEYTPAVSIRLAFDQDGGADGPVDFLTFEPEYSRHEQHDVDRGGWQEWIADDEDADAPEGLWWHKSQAVADMKPLDQWVAEFPNAQIVNPDGYGGVMLLAGCGPPVWDNFIGNTDQFTIEYLDQNNVRTEDTYNFEPGSPQDPTILDCEPEEDSNPTRTDHEIECAVTNGEGVPSRNTEVDVELIGANDPDDSDSKKSPDFQCTTGNTGTCSFVHGPGGTPPRDTSESGNTTYVAWIDVDGENDSVEADRREGRDEIEDDDGGEEGDDREPDGTDVVEKTWVARSATLGGVDAEPETDRNELGESHTISATVYDQAGDEVAGDTKVNFEFFEGSPNDGDGNTPNTPDKTCETDGASSCAITYESESAGTDLVCVFTNAAPAMEGDTSNGTCDGEGRGDEDDDGGQPDEPDPAEDDQDVVSKTWVVPVASQLDCTPETANTPTGGAHHITCQAMSGKGIGAPNANIDIEAIGANDPDNGDSPNSPDFTCTTGDGGTCQVVHGTGGIGRSSAPGTTTYRAWIDVADSSHVEADKTEGRDEATAPGTKGEADNTDVIAATWQTSLFECEPETSSGPVNTPHTIRCSAATGSPVDIEVVGANDPDNSDSPTTPDLTCTTLNGSCSVVHNTTGGGAPANETGATTYRAWVDADGSDTTVEADPAEGQNETASPGTTPESDNTDVLQRTWTQENVTECNDGVDNDGDGVSDYPQDSGCVASTDTDEGNPAPRTCPGYANDPRTQFVGGPGRDVFNGTSGNDIMCGLGGNDKLNGAGGNDLLLGGGGGDVLRGGRGGDTIRGNGGGDNLYGGAGKDKLRGNKGSDALNGGRQRDNCNAGTGRDRVRNCEVTVDTKARRERYE